ncbi:MAG: hypothetical protein AAFR15_17720 [Cyanobacteria bacterium J06627_15]
MQRFPFAIARCAASLTAILLAVGVVSCSTDADSTPVPTNPGSLEDSPAGNAPPATQADSPAAAAEPVSPPEIAAPSPATPPSLAPGRYCYFGEDDVSTLHARISVAANDQVTGDFQGTIANEAAGYYTSYRQALDGTIDGSNLNLDITTWIEYDKQNAQETWGVSTAELRIEGNTLQAQDCATVDTAFAGPNGQEAADLTANASNVKTLPVQFAAGKTGTTLSDAVIRAEAIVYELSAQGGQKMTLTISSLEDNAVFHVVSPSGLILELEQQFAEIFLPERGSYEVIVTGTRGNATYDLEIEIE